MLSTTILRKPLEPRKYQETIFARAVLGNTLVVLPTGLGKTLIAVMLSAQRLAQYEKSKVLILAPTKPLVQQHERTFKEFLDIPDEEFSTFTGTIAPAKRMAAWSSSRVIFSTPQGLENDVLSGKISLADVSLIVFDEAHRAVGDYSYVFLAKRYEDQAQNPRVLALTASPGTDEKSITDVCKHLHIEEIEVRSPEDSDVQPYVQELDISWLKVSLPEEFASARKIIRELLDSRIHALRATGIITVPAQSVTKKVLLAVQGELQGRMAQGDRDMDVLRGISLAAEAMKINHALELLDTQGISSLQKYAQSLREQARAGQSKAVVNLVEDVMWKTACVQIDALSEKNIEHPKLRELRKLILKERYAMNDVKIIIFTQYRDQAVKIQTAVEEIGASAKIFVGQAKKSGTGMSQKEQKAILSEFASGGFTCLIATSVAEEGLDIPKVDLVIFYEPVPSAIRTVQRRGRTGRGEKGKVVVLMTTGTADEGYKWSAHHKEKRMYRAIIEVKKTFRSGDMKDQEREQKTLLQQYYSEKKDEEREKLSSLKVIGDYREKASPVMKEMVNAGVHLELQQLSVGDYHLSDRVVVEYKQIPDFVDSILDGRLLSQLKSLRQYTRPIIIVEGDQDMYAVRKVHPNAIRGMLATITVSFNIPLLWSKSPRETAGLLIALARREQIGGQEWQYHSAKPVSDNELQEYVVAAFPGIGSQLAKPLLEKFGSIRNIVNASETELKEIPLIGEKKAKRFKELSEREYGKNH